MERWIFTGSNSLLSCERAWVGSETLFVSRLQSQGVCLCACLNARFLFYFSAHTEDGQRTASRDICLCYNCRLHFWLIMKIICSRRPAVPQTVPDSLSQNSFMASCAEERALHYKSVQPFVRGFASFFCVLSIWVQIISPELPNNALTVTELEFLV